MKGGGNAAAALRLGLIVVFLIAGVPKLFGSIEQFEAFHYPGWFRVVVGLTEIAGALLLLSPAMRTWGITCLAAVMVGATFSHVNAGDFREALVPLTILAALAFVAWQERDQPHRPEG